MSQTQSPKNPSPRAESAMSEKEASLKSAISLDRKLASAGKTKSKKSLISSGSNLAKVSMDEIAKEKEMDDIIAAASVPEIQDDKAMKRINSSMLVGLIKSTDEIVAPPLDLSDYASSDEEIISIGQYEKFSIAELAIKDDYIDNPQANEDDDNNSDIYLARENSDNKITIEEQISKSDLKGEKETDPLVVESLVDQENAQLNHEINMKFKAMKNISNKIVKKELEVSNFQIQYNFLKESQSELLKSYEANKKEKSSINNEAQLKSQEAEIIVKNNMIIKRQNEIFQIQKELTKLYVEKAKMTEEIAKLSKTEDDLIEEQKYIALFRSQREQKTIDDLVAQEVSRQVKKRRAIIQQQKMEEAMEKKYTENRNIANQRGLLYLKQLQRERKQQLLNEEKVKEFKNAAKLRVEKSVNRAKEKLEKSSEKRETALSHLEKEFKDEYLSKNLSISQTEYKSFRHKVHKFKVNLEKSRKAQTERKLAIVKKVFTENLEGDQPKESKKERIYRKKHEAKSSEKPEHSNMDQAIATDHVDATEAKEEGAVDYILKKAPLMYAKPEVKEVDEAADGGKNFSCSPNKVIFNDFEVGKVYRQKVVLTNNLSTMASFKMHPLPTEVEGLLKVIYSPSGALPAGMISSFVLEFMSPENEDLVTQLKLQSRAGVFFLPIECRTMKCQPVSSSNQIHFDYCGFGERQFRTLVLANKGILNSRYKVVRKEDQSNAEDDVLDEFEETQAAEATGSFKIIQNAYGTLKGYSKLDIKLQFSPTQTGQVQEKYIIKFERDDIADIEFDVFGEGGLPPVYVEQEEIDLGVCNEYNNNTASILLINRGNVSYKAEIKADNEVKRFIGISPSSALIQAKHHFDIQVKLRPREDFEASSVYEFVEKTFRIPIYVHFSNLPTIKVFVKGMFTRMNLDTNPKELLFGRCNVDEKVCISLEIKNDSLLPQTVKFLKIPDSLHVAEENMIMDIPPGDAFQVPITFSSKKEGRYRGKVAIKSEQASSIILPFSAEVHEVPGKLSPYFSYIDFFTSWSQHLVTTILSNTSNARIDFFIDTPTVPNIDLKIYPQSGSIEKHSNIPLYFLFSYRIKYLSDESNAMNSTMPSNRSSAAKSGRNSISNMTRSRRGSVSGNVKASSSSGRRKSSAGLLKAQTPEVQEESKVESWPTVTPTEVTVHIPILLKYEIPDRPGIVLDGALVYSSRIKISEPIFTTKSRIQSENGDPRKIRFGGVPISTKVIDSISITNHTDEEIHLTSSLFNPFGVFSLVKALRPIPPKETRDIQIGFNPQTLDSSFDTLEIRAKNQSMHFFVSGNGIVGSYTVSVDDTVQAIGDTAVNETLQKGFNVTNTCTGNLTCIASIQKATKKGGGVETVLESASSIFRIDPAEKFKLKGEETKEVVVFYTPAEEKTEYECEVLLKVSGSADRIIKYKGKCSKASKKK